MPNPVGLLSLATATPPHIIKQAEAAQAAEQMFASSIADFRHFSRVFRNAGVRTRHVARPLPWFFQPHDWPDRMAIFLEVGGDLFKQAAREALEMAGLTAADVDIIVTVSSTGFATPSLEAHVAAEMGFRPDVMRVPVFGLGCAGGVSGFSIAAGLAAGRPGANVLFVTVELCSLAFQLIDPTRADIVATALFSDGAAACVLRAGERGLATVEATAEHMFPDTLELIGWRIGPSGFGVLLQLELPPFVRDNLGAATAGMLARHGLRMEDIGRFICHPGGAKVIEALESGLSLQQGTLDHERAVLGAYGNMSSPTVLFILQRAIQAGLPERSAMISMGPGFSASCAVLKRAA